MAFSTSLHPLQLVSISWPDILYQIGLLNEKEINMQRWGWHHPRVAASLGLLELPIWIQSVKTLSHACTHTHTQVEKKLKAFLEEQYANIHSTAAYKFDSVSEFIDQVNSLSPTGDDHSQIAPHLSFYFHSSSFAPDIWTTWKYLRTTLCPSCCQYQIYACVKL